ncbi:hypothetical protein CBS147332_3082 [Penicillium roqueforti]|nr:hypothetical protein CBS147332_3082 [Penicillium roqueforti]KAI3125495.1 hypothetical protein CBS147331_489 [Penicillium roqueforti]
MVHILPDSSRWLVHHGFTDEARSVIARLVGTNVELDDPRVQSLHEEIQVAVATESEAGNMSIREMFSGGNLRNGRRMLLCLAAGLGCQMSGINLITQYAPIIFQDSIGMRRSVSQLVAGFNSLEYMLATIPPIFYIERVGRRKVLMWGAFGQSMTMMVLAITVHNGGYAAGIVGAAMLFLFNTIFAQGWLTCTYIIFAVFNAIFIPLVYFFFPETTNLQLEGIDYLFKLKGWTAGARSQARERIQIRHNEENARRREEIIIGTKKATAEHIEKATDRSASSSNESQLKYWAIVEDT